MSRTFTVWGKIRGKGRPRAFGRGKFTTIYTAKEDKLYESQIAGAYINDCGNPAPFGEVPLVLDVMVYFEVPQSFSEKKRFEALNGAILPTKAPDADNILKSIMDALNGKAYPDDKFIMDVKIAQRYDESEKMVVTIREFIPEDLSNEEPLADRLYLGYDFLWGTLHVQQPCECKTCLHVKTALLKLEKFINDAGGEVPDKKRISQQQEAF